ncbi:MAG: hypothetical protein K6B75_05000, partial [Lachnospiraceae bacterium]|nr:hypothetical protein [Lachnospiraceae bacterium]
KEYEITLRPDCVNMVCEVEISGSLFKQKFFRAANEISYIKIYTKRLVKGPDPETDAEEEKDLSGKTELENARPSRFTFGV